MQCGVKSVGILRHWFARGICSLQFLLLPELQAPAVLLGSRFLLLWEAAPTSSSSASLGTLSLAWHGVGIAKPWLTLSLGVLFQDPWDLSSPAGLSFSLWPRWWANTGAHPWEEEIHSSQLFLGADAQSMFAQAGFSEQGWRKQQETIFLHNPRSFFPASTKYTRRVECDFHCGCFPGCPWLSPAFLMLFTDVPGTWLCVFPPIPSSLCIFPFCWHKAWHSVFVFSLCSASGNLFSLCLCPVLRALTKFYVTELPSVEIFFWDEYSAMGDLPAWGPKSPTSCVVAINLLGMNNAVMIQWWKSGIYFFPCPNFPSCSQTA